MPNLQDAKQLLGRLWGYDDFRRGQGEVVDAILRGDDVVAIMPTGSGKSICYQIPGLLLDGLTIVVSPLISLMHDQVSKLKHMGIAADYIDSSLTQSEIESRIYRATQGHYRFLYVSPERLQTRGFLERSQSFNVSLVAVDEAHCVSKWGADFRPEYKQITNFTSALAARPVVAAFTATASDETRQDIISSLCLDSPVVTIAGFARPNLDISVEHVDSNLRAKRACDFALEHRHECGIVYCITRKEVDSLTESLIQAGVCCAGYHAGLSTTQRSAIESDFIDGRIPVIVATSAFGMGIDKPDVRFVLSVGMRDSIEDYYQNIGRAGRDGKASACKLLWSDNDVSLWKWLIRKSLQDSELDDMQIVSKLAQREKDLSEMIAFCKTRSCRHRFLLRHFEEDVSKTHCTSCDNCATHNSRTPSQPESRHGNSASTKRTTKSGRTRVPYSQRRAEALPPSHRGNGRRKS